ncbi:MAG TPA: hypothetical protein VH817_14415 [Thermoleophilaceae bacterium]
MEVVASFHPFIVTAASDWTGAAFGFAGIIVGGLITLAIAWQTRIAAERSWMRDSRRQIYDRFLTKAQQLHVACEACYAAERDAASVKAVQGAHSDFFQVYAVVQTVGQHPVVEASRKHGYRLDELKKEALGEEGVLHPPAFGFVSKRVRAARHDTVDAMRAELGLGTKSVRPPPNYHGFEDVDLPDGILLKEPSPDGGDVGMTASR